MVFDDYVALRLALGSPEKHVRAEVGRRAIS